MPASYFAQAAEAIPPARPLASGVAYEQKFDGHRAILFTPTASGGRLLLQTRRGSLIQDRFPDLVAAAAQLPEGLVLDGELVVWDAAAGRLSFEALQRRAAARGRTAASLAAKTPAFFISGVPSGSFGAREEVFGLLALVKGWVRCCTRSCEDLPVSPGFLEFHS
ncbi:hypothetical protein J7F03_40535 [Streptomyces sp. ISL-43]|uniref:ATP-dependent DNA ligase n=1 Tax=Streptomyces sp. ISL-43 TaxID=2819183 RepID=UPI001BE9B9CD|nr:hypothetical protein [Streptomyces sp. ISL-43]MBT2453193.1 hypothetical protein [Streptomyces sp. ISL-43]